VNVLATRVALRERSSAEVFDLAFRFVVARGGRKYWWLWLLGCGPWLALCVALHRLGVEWVYVWLVALVGFVAAQIPFTLAASRLLLGDDLPLRSLMGAVLARLPGQLFVHVAASITLGVMGLVVVPIPFVAGRLLFLPEITLLEGAGFSKAWDRGGRIFRSRSQAAFETMLLLLVVWAAFVVGVEVTGRAVQVDLLLLPAPAHSLWTGGSWFALCGFFMAVPFLATARFLSYIDGRTRREAWDVQLRFTELAKSSAGGR